MCRGGVYKSAFPSLFFFPRSTDGVLSELLFELSLINKLSNERFDFCQFSNDTMYNVSCPDEPYSKISLIVMGDLFGQVQSSLGSSVKHVLYKRIYNIHTYTNIRSYILTKI